MDLYALIGLSLSLGLAAWLFFMWSVRSGQYDDPEGPKYRMLEDDEPDAARSERAGGDQPPPDDQRKGTSPLKR